MVLLRNHVKAWKGIAVWVLENHCETGLFMMKFQLLDHPLSGLVRDWKPKIPDESAYEHFKLDFKTAYYRTSIIRAIEMRETLCAPEWIVRGSKKKERWSFKNLIPCRAKANYTARTGELRGMVAMDEEIKLEEILTKNMSNYDENGEYVDICVQYSKLKTLCLQVLECDFCEITAGKIM